MPVDQCSAATPSYRDQINDTPAIHTNDLIDDINVFDVEKKPVVSSCPISANDHVVGICHAQYGERRRTVIGIRWSTGGSALAPAGRDAMALG